MTMNHSFTFRALLAASSLFAASFTSRAAVLVEEGFVAAEYPAGSKLIAGEGGGGTVGFGGSWDDGSQFGKEDIVAGSLGFGSLPTAGNKVQTNPSGSFSLVSRPLASTIVGSAGRTLWVGFLLKKTVSRGVGDDNFEFRLIATNDTGLAIGDLGGNDFYSLDDIDDAFPGHDQSAIASTVDATVWLVVKMSFVAGNDTFRLFVNPSPGGSEPNTANAVKTDFNLSNIASIGYLAGSDQTWQLDGIRIGDNYSDLVPEPTTAGMLGLGAGLLAMRRRRAQV